MLRWEVRVGQHIGLGPVDEGGRIRALGPDLVGDPAQRACSAGAVGLKAGLAQRGRGHVLLAVGHMGQDVAHPVRAAALPGGVEGTPDGGLEPLAGTGDDRLHAPQAAAEQTLEEVWPEGGGFRGADMEARDLALAIGVGGHGDYGGDAGGAPALALLETGGIEPETGPFALGRAVE